MLIVSHRPMSLILGPLFPVLFGKVVQPFQGVASQNDLGLSLGPLLPICIGFLLDRQCDQPLLSVL